jgi:N-dimethylarginine dimethylaminohydrolase
MFHQPTILMCPPEFYGIEYEINPWMNTERKVDHDEAQRQWEQLRNILVDLGVDVRLMPPHKGLPDMVFTANAALIHRQTAIVSRFRHEQRQGEEEHDAAWLVENGFDVRRLSAKCFFEGAGDALFCGDTFFAGYRIRSDARCHQQVARMIGCRAIPVELVDPYFYHLDTCFCPLEPGRAVYYPAALDEYGLSAVEELIGDMIAVEPEEARAFACNAVVVGRTVVTNTGCPRLHAALKERGFDAVETPLSEFVKAGGSAKCLTLRLDGEEAAAWKREAAGGAGG